MNTKPFTEGTTFHGETGTIDTSALSGVAMEGMIVEYQRKNPASGAAMTGKPAKARIMRNMSGISLQPGCLVKHMSAYRYRRADGYTCVEYEEAAGVVDDQLGYNVRNGDLFFCIFDGPARIRTKTEAQAAAVYSAGDILYAATQSASTAASTLTGGHARVWDGEFNLTQNTTAPHSSKVRDVCMNAVAVAVSSVAATTDVGALKNVLMRIRG